MSNGNVSSTTSLSSIPKTGDLAVLLSGSPPMIVMHTSLDDAGIFDRPMRRDSVADDRSSTMVQCLWMDVQLHVQEHSFPASVLRVLSPDEVRALRR